MTVYLISRLSINGHKYLTVFLDLQILDDFVVKYLPLPKRYETNFNVPLSIDHSFLRNSKNIFGHCRIFASDATWKLHLKLDYFNLTVIQCWQKRPLKRIKSTFTSSFNKKIARERKITFTGFEIWEEIENYVLLEIRVTIIAIAKSQCLWFGVVILRFARKISYWLSNHLNHFSVFHWTVFIQLFIIKRLCCL